MLQERLAGEMLGVGALYVGITHPPRQRDRPLLRQPDRVHLKTIEKVCRVLDVTPGDVLVRTAD